MVKIQFLKLPNQIKIIVFCLILAALGRFDKS